MFTRSTAQFADDPAHRRLRSLTTDSAAASIGRP
jgi:hypothetical protein